MNRETHREGVRYWCRSGRSSCCHSQLLLEFPFKICRQPPNSELTHRTCQFKYHQNLSTVMTHCLSLHCQFDSRKLRRSLGKERDRSTKRRIETDLVFSMRNRRRKTTEARNVKQTQTHQTSERTSKLIDEAPAKNNEEKGGREGSLMVPTLDSAKYQGAEIDANKEKILLERNWREKRI